MGKTKIGTRAAALCTVLTMLVLLLGGCVEGPMLFTDQQVREYLDSRYPDEKIRMRSDGVNRWMCHFEDLPAAPFAVWVGVSGGDPVPAYRRVLRSDEKNAIWTYYIDTYQKEGGSLDAWTIVRSERNDYSEYTSLTVRYSAMPPVRAAAEQLRIFYDWAEGRPHTSFLGTGRYWYSFNGALPWPSAAQESIDVCEQGAGDSAEDIIELCADAIKTYYAFYRLPCDDFTVEELEVFAAERWNWQDADVWNGGAWFPDVYQGEARFEKERFAGIGVERGAISYGGLYEMLTRLDIPVDGTPEHFSFTGADDGMYEFSYDFCREADCGEGETHITWYYLRNGYMVDHTSLTGWEIRSVYEPILELNKGQNYQIDERHFRWGVMVELMTGLRFE